jgi:2-polyprenyl-3-methyl-5-hydroxy-6-metoxy-1,4-benzoquinol methylase
MGQFLELFVSVQVKLLQRLSRSGRQGGEAYSTASKVARCLGDPFLERVAGKTVIDFGCGEGGAAIELAQRGAERVIGIDIREDVLQVARQKARESGVHHICSFTQSTQERADIIISLDAFEHFAEPAGILRVMDTLLKPEGEVAASFGPTWHHPLGGHLFSVIPWAHLIFSEEALIRWRSGFKTDGATRFGEVAGGLNQITIRKFERIVQESPFRLASLEPVPIRKLRWFHNRFTREFTTAVVRCRLIKRAGYALAGL